MKKAIVIIVINLIFSLVQLSFLPELFGVSYVINLNLAFSFVLLLNRESELALFSALIGGIFVDFLGFSTLGISALSFVTLIYVVDLVQKSLVKGGFWFGGFVFISNIIYSLVLNLPRTGVPDGIFFGALYTVLIFITLHLVSKNYFRDSTYRL